MAEIQSGTKFAAIAPSVDVERRSALVNSTALEYTIEDIAAAVGGDVDLTDYLKIVDAAATYQPLSGMSSYLTTANAATTYLQASTAAANYVQNVNLQGQVYTSLFNNYTLDIFNYSGAPFLGTVTVTDYMNRQFAVRINTGSGTFTSGSIWFFNVQNTWIIGDDTPALLTVQAEAGYECSVFLNATGAGSALKQVAIKNIGGSMPPNTKIWVFGYVM